MRRLLSIAPVLLWLVTPLAFAQLPGITSQPLPGGGQSWSLPVQTLVFITSLTFIPAILLMMTRGAEALKPLSSLNLSNT